MTYDYGHATTAERARIDSLEIKLQRSSITLEELLDLALLHLEPMHKATRAAGLFRQVIASDAQGSEVARLWLAYCLIYEFMEERFLKEAMSLCDRLLSPGNAADLRAAAWMLKATALRDSGVEPFPFNELFESLKAAPLITTRRLLADLFRDRGDLARAREQLELALSIPLVDVSDMPLEREMFEMLVTGRGEHRVHDGIHEQLRKLR
jgi:hypothetical protein